MRAALPFLASGLLMAAAATALADPTPDAAWAHVEEMNRVPATPFANSEEAAAAVHKADNSAREFLERYPADERRWDARLMRAQLAGVLARLGVEKPDTARDEAAFQAILNAPDVPAKIKPEARYGIVQTHLESAPEGTLPPAAEQEIVAFAQEFPASRYTGELQLYRADVLARSDSAMAESILGSLVMNPDPEIAQEAQSRLVMLEVVRKPLELKFKALDGSLVDLAKLRGKVVLIDFWATWCGPCMQEAPELVELYRKLHPRGFEIIGISSDDAREDVLRATKSLGMTWPQYFDGKGPENAIGLRYGIKILPTLWLVNKKGMVVSTQARENLPGAVEKLLAE